MASKITVTHRGADVPPSSTVKAASNSKSQEHEDHRWWNAQDLQMAERMMDVLRTLSRAQKARIQNLASCSRLYGDIPQTTAYGLLSSRLSPAHPAVRNQPITYNAVQIATDTSCCHVAKTRPKPYFLTKGAKFKTKRKAKKLNQLIDGVFYQTDVNSLAPMVYRDALVWGTGASHIYAEHGEVKIERVPAYELWIDALEASTGNPRQLYRVKLVDRDVLADLFPSNKNDILKSEVFNLEGILGSDTVNNLTAVLEGWHLPSGPEAKDGRHAIIVSEGVLLNEKYEKPYFPFSFLRWSPPQTGWWGVGAVEQARPTQLEINQTCWVIQQSHKKGGSTKIWLEEGSNIVEDHLTNDIWSIGWYRGTPPTLLTPTFCPAETYQHLDRLKNTVFDIFGINQLSARSAKPEGLESGAALREYKDQTSERLIIPNQQYEKWHLDTARLCLDAIKEITEEEGNYTVKIPGRKFINTVDWKSINLKDDEYELQCFPISQLPDDPAGRLQTATEWAQAGLITQRQLRRVLDFPDIQSLESLQASSDDYLEFILDRMVDEGVYTAPEPYDDLIAAQEMAAELYQQGKTSEMEDEYLENLRTFLKQCQWLQQQAMPPPAPVAPAPAQPMANPAAAPTSDMLPFNTVAQ